MLKKRLFFLLLFPQIALPSQYLDDQLSTHVQQYFLDLNFPLYLAIHPLSQLLLMLILSEIRYSQLLYLIFYNLAENHSPIVKYNALHLRQIMKYEFFQFSY